MTTSNVRSFFEYPRTQYSANAQKRVEDHRINNLLQNAKKLQAVPSQWNMSKCIDYRPTPVQLHADLELIPDFTQSLDEIDKLTNYIEHIFNKHLTQLYSSEHQNNPYFHIIRYLKTGKISEVRIAMESMLILYSLGPFTHFFDPWAYLDQEHEKYRQNVASFGIKAYQFFAEMSLSDEILSSNLDLTAKYFIFLGDSFRTLAWKYQ